MHVFPSFGDTVVNSQVEKLCRIEIVVIRTADFFQQSFGIFFFHSAKTLRNFFRLTFRKHRRALMIRKNRASTNRRFSRLKTKSTFAKIYWVHTTDSTSGVLQRTSHFRPLSSPRELKRKEEKCIYICSAFTMINNHYCCIFDTSQHLVTLWACLIYARRYNLYIYIR